MKRWLVLLTFGVALLGLGIALILVDLYRTQPLPRFFYTLTLRGFPSLIRAAIVGVFGTACVIIAMIQINRTVLAPFAHNGRPVVDLVADHRRRQRGPKVVAVGGGTGLPVLLRGLKPYTTNLTAVVTVADDGGSSGRLRRELRVLPPGDFRNNIAALAGDESLMTQLFRYRFGEGGLEGHSLGNLFILALSEVTGSFEQALIESSRVLAIQGQVLPSTLENVTLMADLREPDTNGIRRVTGESTITEVAGAIERVFLLPDAPRAYPDAVKAILAAEMIVLGPGSLFTSILPNLLVPGISQATRASRALKIYVCNVATQAGETDHFDVSDHVRAIERHTGPGLFDVVLANDCFPPVENANFEYVRVDSVGEKLRLSTANLMDDRHPWRHNSERLADALLHVFEEARNAS